MELRHIRYFVAVAEEQHFTRAAARLGIGQPPLSQQIKDLEAELGTALLRRVPHGAELTGTGKVFLEECRRTLAASENAAIAVRRAVRGELGRLSLGFTSSAHFNAVVPSTIREFGRHYPAAELRLEEDNTHELLEALMLGTLDVAFTHSGAQDDTRLNVIPVKVEPLVAVLPLAHRCSGDAAVRLADLAGDEFIMKRRSVGPELHRVVFEACRSAGFEPKLGREAPQLATVVSFVAAELGVALVPASMQQVRAAGVAYLPMEDVQASIKLCLVWRRHEASKVVQNFVSLVRSASWQGTPAAHPCAGT